MPESNVGTTQVPLPTPNHGLFDRAVCLSLAVGCLGTRRKVSAASVQVEADKDTLYVSKAILESAELDAGGAMRPSPGVALRALAPRPLLALAYRSWIPYSPEQPSAGGGRRLGRPRADHPVPDLGAEDP